MYFTLSGGAPTLAVSPAGNHSASGPLGGTFTGSPASYTVQNTGGSTLNWGVSGPAWLTFTPASGSLGAGGSQTVTVSINASVNIFGVGAVSGTIVFGGNGGSAARTATLTVNPALTTTLAVPSTTLTAGSAAAAFIPVTATGGTGTLSYAVSPSLPTGLAFNTTSGQITGTPTVASAAANYTVTVTDQTTPTGQNSSKTFSLTVNQAATTTALGAAPNPSTFGQAVTFTATVSPSVPDGGTVTFKDGATVIGTGTTSGGVATFSTTALAVGPHAITATYGGSTSYIGSTSPAVTQTVNQAATTTALGAAPNPSTFGQSVTFTATVSPGVPNGGTVTFKDGVTVIGTGTTSGSVATFSTTALAVGPHSITASVSGRPPGSAGEAVAV